jgi:hypothetical protein
MFNNPNTSPPNKEEPKQSIIMQAMRQAKAAMQIDYLPTSNDDFAILLKALTSKDDSKQQPRRKRVRFSSKLSCCSVSNTNKLTS